MHRSRYTALAAGAALALAAPAQAELGDYGFWDTLVHLFSPPPADNPVRAEQRVGPYPLLANPGDAGFQPGLYWSWQTVRLAPETGAVCGNGSPYKFFVNRVPSTSNTIVYLEGGGACWDQASCSGRAGIRGARNPDGIRDDYMSLLNPGASLVSPFVVRLHPWTGTKSQNWNMVYVPYCTGDVYSGDKVAVYTDETGQQPPLVWHHNGLRNMRSVVSWLKDNLQRPGQMLVTGCSAGGTGSLTNYAHVRRDMAPTRAYLLNDSGPIYPAPRGADPQNYPSLPLHGQIRAAWGLDGAGGTGPLPYLAAELPGFDLGDMGTLYRGLAARFAGDRMGHTQFWEDLNYSSYSYERFFDDIRNEPDKARREQKIHAKWHADTSRLRAELDGLGNFGYYLPHFRDVNESHCATIIDFNHGDVQEQSLEMNHFVASVMDGNGNVLRASETDSQADRNKPFNLIYWLIDRLMGNK